MLVGRPSIGRRPHRLQFLLVIFLLAVVILLQTVAIVRKFAIYYILSCFSLGQQAPSYKDLRQWEDNLPQHQPSLPFPEGQTRRYVLFSNSRVELYGWNNMLNMILMDSLVAYKSNRAYVFHDYYWVDKHYPWPVSQYRDWNPHTPLNAFISGPSAGGPWDEGDDAPRAVSDRYFDTVCPVGERHFINTRDVKPAIYWEDGAVIFETWVNLLAKSPHRCIEIVPAAPEEDKYPQTFDLFFWGSTRSLSLWETFKNSPVSCLLGPSPIVEAAVMKNQGLFSTIDSQSISPSPNDNPFDNVLSIHLRRGDFSSACRDHATWNSTFYNWNLLPLLPDRFDPPPGGSWGRNTPENIAIYRDRCYPDMDHIVEKIHMAREDFIRAVRPGEPARSLDALYIMTNDRTSWIVELKDKLKEMDWKEIVMSEELNLSAEERDVSVAVDMEIGKRSALFIGNGWSSFTSNIAYQRLIDGKVPISIRYL